MIEVRIRSVLWFATGAALALVVSLLVMDAWRADAAPGDVDSTFVPITSCRLIDTRPPPLRTGPHSTWGVKDTKTVQATGTNGDCTIPADAVALSLNVTALNATENGFLTFWPSGALPVAASLNPSPSAPPIPNAVTVALSGAGRFKLYNENGFVDIVIDVNGFYTQTTLKEVDTRLNALEAINRGAKVATTTTDATLISGIGAKSAERMSTGIYKVVFFDSIEECGWIATLNHNNYGSVESGEIGVEQADEFEPDALWVRTFDSATGVEADIDDGDGFTVHVIC